MKNETIWIIGAGSGIGAALAIKLAQNGARLIISGRREETLLSLNQRLEGEHIICPLDVGDSASVHHALKFITAKIPHIDRIINLAAIYAPGKFSDIPSEKMEEIVNINITGMLRIAKAVLPQFEQQGHGQLVLCGSVAGYCGLPASQPYAATKAAVLNLSQSLYLECKPKNIDIKLISPGFVQTRMTDQNDFNMPFIISPERAAEYIMRGLTSHRFEIHFPRRFTLLLKLLCLLPHSLYFFLTKRLA